MPIQTKVIGLDLDDVLASLVEQLNNFHNLNYKTSFTPDDYRQWDLSISWKCTPEDAQKRVFDFFDSEHMNAVVPIEGAVEGVELLAQKYSLVVVTSRPTELEAKTLEWLEKFFPDKFSEVVLTNQFNRGSGKAVTKSEVCRQLGVEIFIDDSLHNIVDVSENRIAGYLFDRPWNQDLDLPELARRVLDWNEIVDNLYRS